MKTQKSAFSAPRVPQLVREHPLTGAIVSKLNSDKQSNTTNPLFSNIPDIGLSVYDRIKNNENIMQLFPDIELCTQILTSSILSPNELVSTVITINPPEMKMPTDLKLNICTAIKTYLNKTYDIENKLTTILKETLFTKGCYVEAIIPEASLDDVINQYEDSLPTVSFEDYTWNKYKTKEKSLGILGTNKYTMSTEDFSINTSNEYDKYKTMVMNKNNKQEKKITITLEDLDIEVYDNPAILGIYNKVLSNKKESMSKLVARHKPSFEDMSDGELLDTLFKVNSKLGQRDFISVNTKDSASRKSIGKPLVIKLPAEAVIPVHVSSNPSQHLGYFILLDENGTPINEELLNSYNDQINMKTSMNTYSNNNIDIISKAKNALYGMTKKDPTLNELEDTYSMIVEGILKKKLKDGLMGDIAALSDNSDIYRVMFARSLKAQRTKLLFLPEELVSYYAFDFRDNGTGKSLLENSSVLFSLRAILLFSNIMGSVKNSTTMTKVKAVIDDDEPDPERVMESVISNAAKNRQSTVPAGITRVNDLVDWCHMYGLSFEFTHPTLPAMTIETSEENTSKVIPDTELYDKISEQIIMSLGLTPEMVESGYNADFATTVTAKNLLLAKRVLQYQSKFNPMVTDNIIKLINNDETIMSDIKEMITNNLKNVRKMLINDIDENLNQSLKKIKDDELIEYLADRFVKECTCTLPTPELNEAPVKKNAFDEYKTMVEDYMDVLINSDTLTDDVIGAAGEHLDAFKATLKAMILKKWMDKNGLLPELTEFVTTGDDGKPIFKPLDEFNVFAKSIMESINPYLKTTKKQKEKNDKILEKITSDDEDNDDDNPDDTDNDNDGDSSDTTDDSSNDNSDDSDSDGDSSELPEVGEPPTEDSDDTDNAPGDDSSVPESNNDSDTKSEDSEPASDEGAEITEPPTDTNESEENITDDTEDNSDTEPTEDTNVDTSETDETKENDKVESSDEKEPEDDSPDDDPDSGNDTADKFKDIEDEEDDITEEDDEFDLDKDEKEKPKEEETVEVDDEATEEEVKEETDKEQEKEKEQEEKDKKKEEEDKKKEQEKKEKESEKEEDKDGKGNEEYYISNESIMMRMSSKVSNIFANVTVVQDRDYIHIKNIRRDRFKANMANVVGSNIIYNNLFVETFTGVYFCKFYAIEVMYTLNLMLNKKDVFMPRTIEKIVEQMKTNTWLKEYYDPKVPDRLDFSLLNKFQGFYGKPLKHQMDFLKFYNFEVSRLNLYGTLLAASAGSGKTVSAIYTAVLAKSDINIIVSPKKAIKTVWKDTLDKCFKNEKDGVNWVADDNLPKPQNCKWFIYHYERLEEAIIFANNLPNQKITLILDESHNINELKSQRTLSFIKLTEVLKTKINKETDLNIIMLSGTPIKAMGYEVMPILKSLDPLFTKEAEGTFKKTFGANRSSSKNILSHRLGLISFKVPKRLFMPNDPIEVDIFVKSPNSKDYTLEAIKNKMNEFITDRVIFYSKEKPKYDKIYYKAIEGYLMKYGRTKEFGEYEVVVNRLIDKKFTPTEFGGLANAANIFERDYIIPMLNGDDRRNFNKAKSIVKYLEFVIRGECLGNVLSKERERCTLEILKNADLPFLLESGRTRTLMFTSYVDVVTEAKSVVGELGYKPLLVYGETNKDLSDNLKAFKADEEINPVIATFKSLSEAVPMIECDKVIMLNAPFRHHEYEQAISRVHRIGQEQQVLIYRLYLDTGSDINISTRSKDIMDWSKEQIDMLLGVNLYGYGDTAITI